MLNSSLLSETLPCNFQRPWPAWRPVSSTQWNHGLRWDSLCCLIVLDGVLRQSATVIIATLFVFFLTRITVLCCLFPIVWKSYVVHFSSGLWWRGKSSHKSSQSLKWKLLPSSFISNTAKSSDCHSCQLFYLMFYHSLHAKLSFLLSIKYTKHLSIVGPLQLFFLLPRILSQSSFSSNVTFSEGLCWPMSYSHPSASFSLLYWTILHPHWLHYNLILPYLLNFMFTVLLFPTKMEVPYGKNHDCLTYQVTLRARTVWQMLKKYFWVISKWINMGRHIKKKTNSGIMLWWDLVENQSQGQGTLTLLGI